MASAELSALISAAQVKAVVYNVREWMSGYSEERMSTLYAHICSAWVDIESNPRLAFVVFAVCADSIVRTRTSIEKQKWSDVMQKLYSCCRYSHELDSKDLKALYKVHDYAHF